MAKAHHSELKDLQNGRTVKAAQSASKKLAAGVMPKRSSGAPMTGVDITYLACFRQTRA